MIIWVAVGGRGTLFGAVIGAILVNYAKTYFTGAFAEIWLFLLGGLFVLTTLYLPRGIIGLWKETSEKISKKLADRKLDSKRESLPKGENV